MVTKKKKKSVLKISFDNQEALRHFALWLCEAGEQDYWGWMEYRESEEENDNLDVTAIDFDYFPNGAKNFVENDEIKAKCGRLDKDDNDEEKS